MTLLNLFLAFLQIGCLSIGGGYAVIALIQQQMVEISGYITLSEFTDIVSISQTTPGPIAINAATFVGMKVAGLPGAFVCTTACIIPTVCITVLIAFIYKKYSNTTAISTTLKSIRPATVGLIAFAAVTLVKSAIFVDGLGTVFGISFAALAIFAVCLFLMLKLRLGSVVVILISGGLGLAVYSLLDFLV